MELSHEPDSFDGSPSPDPGKVVYESVKLHNESAIDHMSPIQKKKVARFYELLANAMPLEGV